MYILHFAKKSSVIAIKLSYSLFTAVPRSLEKQCTGVPVGLQYLLLFQVRINVEEVAQVVSDLSMQNCTWQDVLQKFPAFSASADSDSEQK